MPFLLLPCPCLCSFCLLPCSVSALSARATLPCLLLPCPACAFSSFVFLPFLLAPLSCRCPSRVYPVLPMPLLLVPFCLCPFAFYPVLPLALLPFSAFTPSASSLSCLCPFCLCLSAWHPFCLLPCYLSRSTALDTLNKTALGARRVQLSVQSESTPCVSYCLLPWMTQDI